MRAVRRRILAAALASAAGAGAAGAAFGASSYTTVDPNPCHGPNRKQLLCPNLQMSPPADVWVEHTGGRVLLHGQNSINSRGHGPAELRGHRSGKRTMKAVQVIHKTNGGVMYVNTHAYLGFKAIPGQGSYWKFRNAGVFTLWSVDKSYTPIKQVRTGEKQFYCLRDLKHTKPGKRSPSGPVYPRCNQNSGAQRVTLGTSVGWSDVYPSRYYEQYIDVTGLHGRFGFFQVADPYNGIWESNENDNAGETVVSLPSGRVLATHGPIDRPHRP
ncbi:MAG: hypothetical protein QOK25_1154 [Thermoleophilaceae bacterium]|jgi:hypothetical protein|nr:hypothetical protein [Thermoleophilaceae bacterium]